MSNTRAMNILKLIKITNSSKKYRKLSADAAARRGRRAIAQAKLVKCVKMVGFLRLRKC